MQAPTSVVSLTDDLTLAHFEDLIGHKAMCFAMNRVRGFSARRIDEAKDLSGLLVDPVALVIDAVGTLNFDVLGVSTGDIGR